MSKVVDGPTASATSKSIAANRFLTIDPLYVTGMPQSILAAIQWPGRPVFDLASLPRHISVRDQLVRGWLVGDGLVDWMAAQSHITDQHKVLVIGAGIAGLSAAVRLAEKGREVDIVDANASPFHLQIGCKSRWLDPTAYDWPMNSWQAGVFPLPWPSPLSLDDPPFGWTAKWANEVAGLWNAHWSSFLDRYPNVDVFHLTRFVDFVPSTSPRLESVAVHNGTTVCELGPYAAVVYAVGVNEEVTTVQDSPQFMGFGFWTTDPFHNLHCGMPSPADCSPVLISGTGDGALQDLLRILTGQASAATIFQQLDLPAFPQLAELLSEELEADRALNLRRDDRWREPYFRRLRTAHRRTIQALLKDDPQVADRVRHLVRNRPAEITLVNYCDYFTALYALNRFLAELFLTVLKGQGVRELMSHELVRIDSNRAPSNVSAQGCVGCEWRVELRDRNAEVRTSVTARVVIIRHGPSRTPTHPFPVARPNRYYIPSIPVPRHLL